MTNQQGLTPDEERRLSALVAGVLSAGDQNHALLDSLAALDDGNEPALACALFESMVWRIEIKNHWIFYRMAGCYRLLGREDAAFLLSALADRKEPHFNGAYRNCLNLFSFLRRRGRARDALDVFFSYAARFPAKAFAAPWELLPLAARTGQSLAPLFGDAQHSAGEALRQNRTVIDATTWEGWTCPVYGGLPAIALEKLTRDRPLPAIQVACLPNAEVLLCNDALAVLDADGGVHGDLSLHEFPMLLKLHMDRQQASGGVEQVELDAAVITTDRFVSPNLCHFLLDHMTRLHLYERAGVDIGAVTLIEANPPQEFQRAILQACGVSRVLHTGRTARVRVGQLWVNSNWLESSHPAHYGSSWAIDFLRGKLVSAWPAAQRRIYISRRDAQTRRVTNEAEVLALLGRYGFEVIVPGELPYREQVAAFAAASHVVGPHGAGLTNVALCRPGTQVLEIFHPLYGTAAFAMAAHGGQLRYAALVGRDGHSAAPEFNDAAQAGDTTRGRFGRRDIEVDVAELRRWLDAAGAAPVWPAATRAAGSREMLREPRAADPTALNSQPDGDGPLAAIERPAS